MKVLKFYAEWCGPCKSLATTFKSIEDKIAFPIENINIDEELMTSVEFGVRSVPTVILIDDNNAEVRRHVGAMTESQLLDFLKV
jgi:thioredoxin-like negative regulator of GroEL